MKLNLTGAYKIPFALTMMGAAVIVAVTLTLLLELSVYVKLNGTVRSPGFGAGKAGGGGLPQLSAVPAGGWTFVIPYVIFVNGA